MRNTIAIARRELGAYFSSPVAYLVTAGFLLICGLFFSLILINTRSANARGLYTTMYTLLLFLAPMLSMRLLSEEYRTGTIELLATSPIRDIEIVLGKFLGVMGLLVVMLGLTLAYPLMLLLWGSPDIGILATSYLGGLLFGGAALAIGLFASSLTQNQIIAAVLSFAAFLVLWVADGLGQMFSGTATNVLSYLSLFNHFNDLSKGIVDTKDVLYFLSMIAVALFLTTRTLEARRWKA